jgi:hypothetical protein
MTEIFVFGSNLAGIHGAGAAAYARMHHGAIWGQGVGLQGESYAIPTKDADIWTLSTYAIKKHVDRFLQFAENHHTLSFKITAIGCGLAGYQPKDIAPMFEHAPNNCLMPPEWANVEELKQKNFWRYPDFKLNENPST